MGSIVGAGYASGRTVAELEAVIADTDWDALFNESPPRRMVRFRNKPGRDSELFGAARIGIQNGSIAIPSAIIEGQYIEILTQALFGKSDPSGSFDDLPIPFRAVAADIETGEAVILKSGSLARAARASMSVPGFFTPVEIDGRLLVDGGITNNFPVDIALDMGAERIIAVQFQSSLRKQDELRSPLAISGQILNLFLKRTSQPGLELLRDEDVLIQPDISEYSSTSFKQAKAIIKAGEDAARALIPQLKKFSVSASEFEQYTAERTGRAELLPLIDFVRVEGVEPHRAQRIASKLDVKRGQPLDRSTLEAIIKREFQSGEFKRLGYEFETVDGKQGLVVNAREKDWLRNYLRLGFSLEDDFDGSNFYSLAVSLRLNDLNEWGAYSDSQLEIGRSPRIFTEWYQPLGQDSSLFIAPELSAGRRLLTIRQDGETVARYFRETAVAGLKAGVALGRFGEFLVGVQRGTGKLDRDIGDLAIPEFDYDIGEVFTRLMIDQLDDPDFPTGGYRLALTGAAARDRFGASNDYEQGRIVASLPVTHERTTFLFNAERGYSSDDIPVEQSYALGGIFDISGYQQGSLTADNYWVARMATYYRFLEGESSLLDFGGYLGATVEYATLRSEIESIGDTPDLLAGSVFVGIDTPLLPVYLAFGLSDESERAVYLTIGKLSARRR
jgi:NTE family protein